MDSCQSGLLCVPAKDVVLIASEGSNPSLSANKWFWHFPLIIKEMPGGPWEKN